jgi:TDG/mug DNA glycosylase family protein
VVPRDHRTDRSQRRPTPDEIRAAHGRFVPDLVAPGLTVLFCGINPSLYSAAVGHHFARPGNRFWPALYGGGFTDRVLRPSEERELLRLGLGITNIVERATAAAAELAGAELVAGAARLGARVARDRPRLVAFLGVTAYRTAFAQARAKIGPRDEPWHGARVWILPTPSGLNAHYTPEAFARESSARRGGAPSGVPRWTAGRSAGAAGIRPTASVDVASTHPTPFFRRARRAAAARETGNGSGPGRTYEGRG